VLNSSSIIWGWYNRPVVAAVPSGLSLTPLRIIDTRWSSVLVSCCCEKVKLVAEGREQFGNPEERERPQLEAVTRKLVNTQHAEKI
jgi:hypothetical protein